MQDSSEHPLLTKRMGGVVAVLALCSSVGLALMSFDLATSGLIVSVLGGIGAVWIYWTDFKRLRLRLATIDGTVPLPGEIVTILMVLTIGLGAPVYVFLKKTWPVQPIQRILSNADIARMITALRIPDNEHYSCQINTVASCDECEEFAEQLRWIINKAPGWSATGGPLMFSSNNSTRGMWVMTNAKGRNSRPVRLMANAFAEVGYPLEPKIENDFSNELPFVVIIGRR